MWFTSVACSDPGVRCDLVVESLRDDTSSAPSHSWRVSSGVRANETAALQHARSLFLHRHAQEMSSEASLTAEAESVQPQTEITESESEHEQTHAHELKQSQTLASASQSQSQSGVPVLDMSDKGLFGVAVHEFPIKLKPSKPSSSKLSKLERGKYKSKRSSSKSKTYRVTDLTADRDVDVSAQGERERASKPRLSKTHFSVSFV